MRPRRVGIERIAAYAPTLAISMDELCAGRGHDPRHPAEELLVRSRCLNPLWEDPVTMAVNAARSLLTDADREAIELIIVGTESSPDFGKPISTYVQRWCNIQPRCRNFETKAACYGGTAALMTAAHWVASGARPGKKALVISTDQSRTHLGAPWEYVLGAGAVALLVSAQPDFLELELDKHGYWSTEIHDTFRPTSTTEVGNADTSLYAYIEALEGAYDSFRERVGDVAFEDYFDKNIYHVPFGGMTYRAHRTLLKRERSMPAREARAHFERKSLPALVYNAQLGGTYTSATFLAMLGLVDSCEDLQPGARVGVFSYGSGSSAEFYCARVGDAARAAIGGRPLQGQLDARHFVDFAAYEALERARVAQTDVQHLTVERTGFDGLYERAYRGQERLVLTGVDDWCRRYELS